MSASCPIPTPAQRVFYEVQAAAEALMMDKIAAALAEAQATVATGLRDSGLDGSAPPYGYFAATAHQTLYCILCDADPSSMKGGDATKAMALIRNAQNIAKHYWGADIEPYPRSS